MTDLDKKTFVRLRDTTEPLRWELPPNGRWPIRHRLYDVFVIEGGVRRTTHHHVAKGAECRDFATFAEARDWANAPA